MVLNYIGSKRTLAHRLVEEIKKEWSDLSGWNFCDVFAGTGALSMVMAPQVKSITVNDWEDFSVALLEAQFNSPVYFMNCYEEIEKKVKPVTGAITNTYSEIGGRLFFTTLNAQKIDGYRLALRSPSLTHQERNYLLGCLVSSADSIANVASVYGAYLKDIKTSAAQPFRLHPIVPSQKRGNVLQMDADALCKNPELIDPNTILYLDPPYNQRQYGANYFPLNAIVDISANEFLVSGVTGIPTAGYKKSAWCSKKTAPAALKSILEATPARRLVLSYNQEGNLTHAEITALFTQNGWRVRRIEIPYKRFASQKDLEPNIMEYLFVAARI
jgi:adenine-specific DNA-methyltransferase